MIFFDPLYFLFLAPAIILALWAQSRVQSAYAAGLQIPSRFSGAQAAREVLDSVGLYHVRIEQVGGHLTDHYDPRAKVLRLSPDVYHGFTAASIGIAAHEAGHAIQDAKNYLPLMVRNAAVPLANFGSGFSWILIFAGLFFSYTLVWVGIAAFSAVVFFQLINLPVEFDASARAKERLVTLGLVSSQAQPYVKKVLGAAAMTYVAGTLQSVLTLLYLIFRFGGLNSDE